MTLSEQSALLAACPEGVTPTFRSADTPGFVEMLAGPCPCYQDHACVVYSARPVNCRRYACGRDDVRAEAWVDVAVPLRVYRDRDFRRQMVHLQRDAMRQWGHAHGWSQT